MVRSMLSFPNIDFVVYTRGYGSAIEITRRWKVRETERNFLISSENTIQENYRGKCFVERVKSKCRTTRIVIARSCGYYSYVRRKSSDIIASIIQHGVAALNIICNIKGAMFASRDGFIDGSLLMILLTQFSLPLSPSLCLFVVVVVGWPTRRRGPVKDVVHHRR